MHGSESKLRNVIECIPLISVDILIYNGMGHVQTVAILAWQISAPISYMDFLYHDTLSILHYDNEMSQILVRMVEFNDACRSTFF